MGIAALPSHQEYVKVLAGACAAIAVFMADWFYLNYMHAYGFEANTVTLRLDGIHLAFQSQWLPILGVVLVSFVLWFDVGGQIYPKRVGSRWGASAGYRLLRAVAISFAVFVCVLYIPYLLGSNWFWARLSDASRTIAFIRNFALSLGNLSQPIMSSNSLLQYSASQISAAAAMIIVGWLTGRTPRPSRR